MFFSFLMQMGIELLGWAGGIDHEQIHPSAT